MNEFLAFVDEIGRTIDGKYLYRFDYTEEPEVVWGDYFNIAPAVIIPNLQVDINCLSHTEKIISDTQLNIAKKNGCFSMQDCIDGIIPLCFSEISEKSIYFKDNILYFYFGEDFESVQNKLKECEFKSLGLETVEKGDETIIDELIEKIGEDGE